MTALFAGASSAFLVWGILTAALIAHDLLFMHDPTQAPTKPRLILCGFLFGAWAAFRWLALTW